jgi:cytidylate kinase
MPIITISRGTFSGGRALAECLAQRLDYACVSREVILDAAKEFGISPDKLNAAMAEPPTFWQDVPGKRMSYLNYIRAVLLEYARGGKLVYHGHAGHLLLAGISHVIRVRVIADMEFRTKAAMEQLNLDRNDAIAHIQKVDNERIKWTRYLYGLDWQDASLYDVVLNLEHLSLDGACNTVVRMAQLAEFQPTPESERVVEDLALGTRVWLTLTRDDRTKNANVQVISRNGVVTIRGGAGAERTLEIIPSVARQVKGVKHVECMVGMGSDWYW